jgi:hypothetical protein
MDFASRAEQLPLHEQLYLLLTDPGTGEPPTARRRRTQGVLAAGVLWELIERGAMTVDPGQGEIAGVSRQALGDGCLQQSLEAFRQDALPMSPLQAVQTLAGHLPSLWQAIGKGMIREGLVHEEVKTVLLLFHRNVLSQTAEAAREERTLEADLRAAVQEIGAHHEDEIVSHRRLVARLVLLDNFGLLREMVGGGVYDDAADRIAAMKGRLRDVSRLLRAGRTPAWDPDPGWSNGGHDAMWFLDSTGSVGEPGACGDSCGAFGGGESGGGGVTGGFGDSDGDSGSSGGSDSGSDSGGGGGDSD